MSTDAHKKWSSWNPTPWGYGASGSFIPVNPQIMHCSRHSDQGEIDVRTTLVDRGTLIRRGLSLPLHWWDSAASSSDRGDDVRSSWPIQTDSQIVQCQWWRVFHPSWFGSAWSCLPHYWQQAQSHNVQANTRHIMNTPKPQPANRGSWNWPAQHFHTESPHIAAHLIAKSMPKFPCLTHRNEIAYASCAVSLSRTRNAPSSGTLFSISSASVRVRDLWNHLTTVQQKAKTTITSKNPNMYNSSQIASQRSCPML